MKYTAVVFSAAQDIARQTNQPVYVIFFEQQGRWQMQSTQFGVANTHWRILPTGEIGAHTGDNNTHCYEPFSS